MAELLLHVADALDDRELIGVPEALELDEVRVQATVRVERQRLPGGDGERNGWLEEPAEALVIEGWLMGCRALGPQALGERLDSGRGWRS